MILYNDRSEENLTDYINDPETLRRFLNGYDSMYLANLLSDDELQDFCRIVDKSFNTSEGQFEEDTLINKVLRVFGKGKSPEFIGKMTYKDFCEAFWNCRDDFAKILGYKDYEDMKKSRA